METILSQKERDCLRRLVADYMEAATLTVQKEKIELWKALNRRQMQRPMVVIDQLPWNELQCDELCLEIADPYWRAVENMLRQTLYKWRHFPVDMVLDPFIGISKVYSNTGYGLDAQVETRGVEDSTAKAQRFTNILKNLEDVKKITDCRLTYNAEATERVAAQAEELFGDLAPVRLMGHSFHIGIWDFVTQWMSVEDAYYAFVDEPELLHAIMERMTEATLVAIEDANRLGLHNDLANTCHCSYIYTDELLPYSGEGKGPYSQNCWAFGLAQLFTSLSPAQFEEFELPYVTRLAEKFGMLYYGCCDKLDDRLDLVKRIPHVRKVSCSPWSNREHFAACLGPELIMSNKPTPALLATDAFHEEEIRADLCRTCEAARRYNVNLELILKDVSTVRNDPARLTRWADIAMQVVEKYAR